ncbi:MAG: hypothetical protein SFW67_17045 [Myxococcaceae bacterium]|nr:hypothetical protein [Myxococcaceae bacterium]
MRCSWPWTTAGCLLAFPAFAEVCDKLDARSGLDVTLWLAGPLLACAVTTMLVARGSTLAAAAATVLSIVGFLELKESWSLVRLAQAEPCGASVLREAWLRGASLLLLFSVPNGLWSYRRAKAETVDKPS